MTRAAVVLPVILGLASRAPDARAQPTEPSRVTLHLDAPRGTVLLGLANGRGAWEAVCAAPCDASVDRSWSYFVHGGGQFRVDALPPGSTAQVAVPSHVLARTSIVVGGLLVAAGIALSWTGNAGLVWQATQHQSVPWATAFSIASIPVELAGSGLVVAGAVDLLTRRSAVVTLMKGRF